MKIEIDQSGKVEQTNKPTILCIASKTFSDTIIFPANDKRILQSYFRQKGQIRNFILFTFSAMIAILLERNSYIHHVVIDKEYIGKEGIIMNILLEMLSEHAKRITIQFDFIGKSSNAHKQGYNVFKGKIKANKVVNLKEIHEKIKKTEAFRLSNA